jgi:hypothetical protein
VTAAFELPVAVSQVLSKSTAPPVGGGGGGGGGGIATVTLRPALVVTLPAASRATAVSTCVPFDAVVASHVIEYGAEVSSAP